MEAKPYPLHKYEQDSGLAQRQLWPSLMPIEQERLKALGFRNGLLPPPALEYLKEIFPLPENRLQIVSMTMFEKNLGFGKGAMVKLLSAEQLEILRALGYRPFHLLPYRAIVYLRELGFY